MTIPRVENLSVFRQTSSTAFHKGILKYIHRSVLPEHKAYLLANYFKPIIDNWPFDAFVSDYLHRHSLHLDVPLSCRQRIEEIQLMNQTKVSLEKYGYIRHIKGFTHSLDWFPILTGANEVYFGNLHPKQPRAPRFRH